jgi:hypothetical protein
MSKLCLLNLELSKIINSIKLRGALSEGWNGSPAEAWDGFISDEGWEV